MCVSSTVVISVLPATSVVFLHHQSFDVSSHDHANGRGREAAPKARIRVRHAWESKMKFYPATRIELAIWPLATQIDLVQLVGQVWRAWIRSLLIRHLRR